LVTQFTKYRQQRVEKSEHSYMHEVNFAFLVKFKGDPVPRWEDEYFLKRHSKEMAEFARRKLEEEERFNNDKDASQFSASDRPFNNPTYGLAMPEREKVSMNYLLTQGASSSLSDTFVPIRDGYEIGVLGYLATCREKGKGTEPTMVVIEGKDSERWLGLARLYFPELECTFYVNQPSSSRYIEDHTLKLELYIHELSYSKVDVLFVDFASLIQHTSTLGRLYWRNLVLDLVNGPTEQSLQCMHLLCKNSYRTPSRRIVCMVISSPLKIQANNSLNAQSLALSAFLIAGLRFVNFPGLPSALLKSGIFSNASPDTLDFYLSVTPSLPSHLASCNPTSVVNLHGALTALLAPIVSQLQSACSASVDIQVIDRTIVLRCSDSLKQTVKSTILANLPLLFSLDGLSTPPPQLSTVFSSIIDSDIIGGEESVIVEADSKLKWTLKYLDSLKFQGRTERLVMIFTSETTQLRFLQPLQRFTKYTLWQINSGLDSSEIDHRIAAFNKIDSKIAVLTVCYSNIHLLKNVLATNFFIVGLTGETTKSEVQRILLCCQKIGVSDLKIFRLLYEGVEEKIHQYNKRSAELTLQELNDALKYKYYYVVNTSTIFKLEQVDHTFKRLLEDAQEVSKGDECIVHRSKGGPGHHFSEKFTVNVGLKRFDFHFENVVEDANPLASWHNLKDKNISIDITSSTAKKLMDINLVGLDFKVLHPFKNFNTLSRKYIEDDKLETYLQKRFLSPRLEKLKDLPQPFILHTMDFAKMLCFLEFVLIHGIYFDSIDSFYKRYCVRYPDEITSSAADFENFKNYIKEFVHLLAYHHTSSFRSSIMLCGLNIDKIYSRVIGITIANKLLKKYSKTPEEFMLHETIRCKEPAIAKKGSSGYDYKEKHWNNFDLYCLCHGTARHGFGEWEAIVKDESVWANIIKAHEPEITAQDEADGDEDGPITDKGNGKNAKQKEEVAPNQVNIVDILFEKLCPSQVKLLKDKPFVRQ
jgi:hypothetical protein